MDSFHSKEVAQSVLSTLSSTKLSTAAAVPPDPTKISMECARNSLSDQLIVQMVNISITVEVVLLVQDHARPASRPTSV